MKPPPRQRTKPDRNFKPQPVQQGSGKQVLKKWSRAEQNKLLRGLRRLSRTGGNREIDYDFLTKYVPRRSVSEVQSMVELLKHKVVTHVSYKVKRMRWEEENARKPIEVWTHMASVVAGTLEESISAAFSQMLTVSSTEPRTLRNGDPPQVHRLPTDKDSRTVPWRPMPRLAVQGERPSTKPAQPLQGSKSPAAVVRLPIIKIPPAPVSNTAGTAISPPSVIVTPRARQAGTSSSSAAVIKTQINTSAKPTLSRPRKPLSSPATGPTTVPSATPSPAASPSSATSHSSSTQSTPALSTPAAAIHDTSKFATKDSPRMLGVKSVVDFENIYRYLSCINKPNEGCCLTPMESAIVLDLLMSLPEELPLLDCNRLHQHLIQVYHSFSSPADSKIAKEMFKEMKTQRGTWTETMSGPASGGTNGQQDTAGTADNGDVTQGGGKKIKPDETENQSSGNSDASSQSKDAGVMPPPLNPFMIPLKLLKRK